MRRIQVIDTAVATSEVRRGSAASRLLGDFSTVANWAITRASLAEVRVCDGPCIAEPIPCQLQRGSGSVDKI